MFAAAQGMPGCCIYRCSLQALPGVALRDAASEAAPALQLAHALMRRPGSGKGRKHSKNAALAEAKATSAAAARAAASARVDLHSTDDRSNGSRQPADGAASSDCQQPSAAAVPATDAEVTNSGTSPGGMPSVAGGMALPVNSSASPIPMHTADNISDTAAAARPTDGFEKIPSSIIQLSTASASAAEAPAAAASNAQITEGAPVQLQQLTRLTLAADDPTLAAQLDGRPDITSGYDVVAIEPLSERVLQQVRLCCQGPPVLPPLPPPAYLSCLDAKSACMPAPPDSCPALTVYMQVWRSTHCLVPFSKDMTPPRDSLAGFKSGWQLPTSATSPVQACMSLKVDLITFNFTRRLPFRLKPTLLQAAVGRGVHFEVRSSALPRAHTACLWASCCFAFRAEGHAARAV